MIGAHDLGGMHGFGAIDVRDDQVFHADWEGLTFALVRILSMSGLANADEMRQSREQIGNSTYLSVSYYMKWLLGFESVLVDRAVVSEAEVRARRVSIRDGDVLDSAVPVRRAGEVEEQLAAVRALLRDGVPKARRIADEPQFAVGERVRVLARPIRTHTRCPRYLWDRAGIVTLLHGAHVFPDTSAIGMGENPQHLYTVVFDGAELWGDEAEDATSFSADLWESYLAPAPAKSDRRTRAALLGVSEEGNHGC